MAVSVLTIMRNRAAHLEQLVVGLCRSRRPPDELIIIDMSDKPVEIPVTSFPTRIDHFVTNGLPLAAARNRAASLACCEDLVFLDVDCIPMEGCIATLVDTLDRYDALLCADVRYLKPEDTIASWTEADLLARGTSHPVRDFPSAGVREEDNPGLFWSLAFAMKRKRFIELGGFDERYTGYGAEDTDFGFRARQRGVKLLFVGGAIACHQYHDTYDPPLQHVADIVRNATQFREVWGRWPMEGWLTAFKQNGLVHWDDNNLELLRLPSPDEVKAAKVPATS